MARGLSDYAERVEQATPTERDRYVDLLRGAAICAVVVGHWLVASVFTRADGRLDGLSVLEVAGWTHWFTWLLQVMPIFFLVGGYANATSWQRHAEGGGSWPAWAHRRSVRLLRPTAVFVAVTIGAVVLARLANADPVVVDQAAWVAGIMLWFLAVYVAVAGLTPLTYRLHERFGVRATLALAVAVAAGDVARVVTTEPLWAAPNYVLGWALIHQIGYWWREGALPSRAARTVPLAAVGLAALAALVVVGPWPVAMVDVPGATVQNSSPPSLALLALVAVQTAVMVAVADRAREWLRRPVPWAVVASVNRVVLTLFLWHMTAVVVGAAALYGSGLLPEPAPLSDAWFAWRPVWLVALAAITAGFVLVFGPVERRAGRPVPASREAPGPAAVLAGLGVPAACGGLAWLTIGGLAGAGPLGLPVVGATLFGAGVAMTTYAGRFVQQPARA